MNSQQNELAARIDSVKQLGSVVGVLRSIAAARTQHSHDSLAGIRRYADTLAGAIAHALALMPALEPTRERGGKSQTLLLFCAEQGFAGNFTERVFAAAGSAEQPHLLVVGRRGVQLAAAHGLKVDWSAPAIAHLSAAPALADRIAAELLSRIGVGNTSRVEIVCTRVRDDQSTDVQRLSLLPLELQRFRRELQRPAPLVQLPPALLLERLTLEYLRAQLTEAIVQNFAAENLARMQAMSAARDNIAHTLEDLQRAARVARQDAITAEVVELSAGTEAQRLAAPR